MKNAAAGQITRFTQGREKAVLRTLEAGKNNGKIKKRAAHRPDELPCEPMEQNSPENARKAVYFALRMKNVPFIV